MIKAAKIYVRYMDATSRVVGRVVMFLIFAMIGTLLFETVSRNFFNRPQIWTLETAQFLMAAYYLLGGGYVLLIGGHVRMDLFYGKWSAKKKATFDVITFFIVLIYLGVLMYGGIQSTLYAIKYNQVTYSAWAPPMIPIKIIMTTGIALMFLQAVSEFIKNLAKASERIDHE